MNRRQRGVIPAQSPAQPGWPFATAPPEAYDNSSAAPAPGPAQCLRFIPVVSCDPAPFETALDHDTITVWSATANGPAVRSGDLVNDAFESLGSVAVRFGADGLYSVRLNTAVDNGWMYVTAMATATVPLRPSPASWLDMPNAPWER